MTKHSGGAWNDFSETRAFAKKAGAGFDPAKPGYSGPPVVALMGYRGPYPVDEPLPPPPLLPRDLVPPRRRVGRPRKNPRDAQLAQEVAEEFKAAGWAG